ncbi:replication-associated recombination protein A, partial [Sutterella wadsworthensis]
MVNAIKDKSRGLGELEIVISDDSLNFIANNANGDARVALNNLELAVSLENKGDGVIKITPETLETVIQKKDFDFGNGDTLYNTMSAFQKSLRGSDVDASLYYLARMLLGGELEAVCRRLMVCVYEDVGIANPLLPMRVNLAIETALQVG